MTPEFIPVFSVALQDESLDKLDCLVLGAVYWFERLKDGKCFASNEAIGSVVGTKNNISVANSLKRLETSGYIERVFSDEKKRNRTCIKLLIGRYHPQMKPKRKVSSTDESVSSTDDTHVSSTDEQRENIVNKNIKGESVSDDTVAEDPIRNRQIGELIKQFETINPACKRYYGNKTQRKACVDLIETVGFDQAFKVVRDTLPMTNKIAYMPTITTPLQLFERYSTLESAINKAKNKVETKTKNFII